MRNIDIPLPCDTYSMAAVCEQPDRPYNGCIGADGPVGCPGTQIGPINSNSKIREINIEQLSYGYIVRVGYQKFAIETADKLIEYLTKYINKPDETEKDWYSGNLLKTKNGNA